MIECGFCGQDALLTFSEYFTLIIVVGVGAVILLLLGALKRAGGRTKSDKSEKGESEVEQ